LKVNCEGLFQLMSSRFIDSLS